MPTLVVPGDEPEQPEGWVDRLPGARAILRAILRAMDRQTALRLAARLAWLIGAAMLASGGWLSLILADCPWGRGGLCGGDMDAFFEGYVTGVALMATAAALAVRAFTRRWPLIAAAALVAVGASVAFAVYLEQID